MCGASLLAFSGLRSVNHTRVSGLHVAHTKMAVKVFGIRRQVAVMQVPGCCGNHTA